MAWQGRGATPCRACRDAVRGQHAWYDVSVMSATFLRSCHSLCGIVLFRVPLLGRTLQQRKGRGRHASAWSVDWPIVHFDWPIVPLHFQLSMAWSKPSTPDSWFHGFAAWKLAIPLPPASTGLPRQRFVWSSAYCSFSCFNMAKGEIRRNRVAILCCM